MRLTAAPRPLSETFYQVDLSWSGHDPDGRIERFEYALDPEPDADTTWTATRSFTLSIALPATSPSTPVPAAGTVAYARDAHTFVLRAVDGAGDVSPVVARSFTARTVSPDAFITAPVPNRQQPTSTRPSVTIRWRGTDTDAISADGPVGYRARLVLASVIRPSSPENVSAAQIQEYFAREAAGGFVGWERYRGHDLVARTRASPSTRSTTSPSSRSTRPGPRAALPARRERAAVPAAAQEPGPRITLENEFFRRTQSAGGISLDPSRIVSIECPRA